MKNTFIDFIKTKNNINEGFSEKNLNKAIELIISILRKNISGKVIALPGFIITKSNDDILQTKQIIVNLKKSTNIIYINWLKSNKSSEVYSIDIFNSSYILYDGKDKSAISIYTLGSSIVYFLPAIWYIINNQNFNISKEEISNLSKKIFKNNKIKESYFYVGSLCYHCLENVDNFSIKETFILNEEAPNDAIRNFKQKKRDELDDAFNHRKDSDEAAEKYKKLESEYAEIRSAIAGGANNLQELRMVIKQNISVIEEINDTLKDAEQKFKEERDDPEVVFKKMSGYIKMVIKGINPSLIICGAPGVGKTYRVKKQLKDNGYEEDKNMLTIKGKCTPRQLYLALYNYKKSGQILVVDDADSLVGPNAPEDCINILKAALDSTSEPEGRLVAYGVTGKLVDDEGIDIPKRFYYNGGIIVITNWNAGKLDTALRGRSYIQDINFTNDEVLQIIKSLMSVIEPNQISPKSKLNAYNYLKEISDSGAEMEISIRTFTICAKIFEVIGEDDDFTEEDAKSMIREQMKLQAARITGRGNIGKY